jgi:hypothetical protein
MLVRCAISPFALVVASNAPLLIKAIYLSHMRLPLILTFLLLTTLLKAEVSLTNLQAFWESTYDANKDGHATMQEFTDYFQLMES